MDLEIVNPQPKYGKVTLIEPPPLGYLHVAAAVDPPRGRTPFPGNSPQKAALLTRLRSLARQLGRLGTVQKATVYRAILVAPPTGYAKQQATHVARYDVVVLLETTSPEVLGEVQATQPCKLLVEAVTEAATDVHVMTARCPKRVGDVDKTRQGLFLFNYFVADDAGVALQLWDYLAGWYAVETGLGNSTLLETLGDADYVFVNHARWDHSLPRFMVRQLDQAQLPHLPARQPAGQPDRGDAHPLPARLTGGGYEGVRRRRHWCDWQPCDPGIGPGRSRGISACPYAGEGGRAHRARSDRCLGVAV
jgi:hypothetical protein